MRNPRKYCGCQSVRAVVIVVLLTELTCHEEEIRFTHVFLMYQKTRKSVIDKSEIQKKAWTAFYNSVNKSYKNPKPSIL